MPFEELFRAIGRTIAFSKTAVDIHNMQKLNVSYDINSALKSLSTVRALVKKFRPCTEHGCTDEEEAEMALIPNLK